METPPQGYMQSVSGSECFDVVIGNTLPLRVQVKCWLMSLKAITTSISCVN